jgi:hypothetical protein
MLAVFCDAWCALDGVAWGRGGGPSVAAQQLPLWLLFDRSSIALRLCLLSGPKSPSHLGVRWQLEVQ